MEILKGYVPSSKQTPTHYSFMKANILIDKDKRACVADFGLTTITGTMNHISAKAPQEPVIPNELLKGFTGGGTYRWMSPELLYPEKFGIPESEGNRPTIQSDCYALGMVIYEVGIYMHEFFLPIVN